MGSELETHLSLLIALGLILVLEFASTFNTYRRDWCGYRLALPILLQALVPMAIVTLIYFELFHVAGNAVSRRYFYLISFAAASLAHFGYKVIVRISGEHTESVAIFAIVETTIAAKRLQLMRQLSHSGNCHTILTTALDLSDLSHARRTRYKKALKAGTCDETKILAVIDSVGIAVMQLVMKGVV